MTADELLGLLRDTAQGASNSAASTVSAPVDVLAWLLRKGGLPVGPAPVLGSDWMAQKGLTAQPKNALAGMAGETIGNILPIVAAAKAPQIANALLRADEALQPAVANALEQYMVKQGMIQPATVWHGSPHKFDKFDASKIGTGEGAQAYGHGLYLAESPAVASQYRNALSDTLEVNGQALPLEKRAAQMALTFGDNTTEGALKWLSKFEQKGANHVSPAMTPELVKQVKEKFLDGTFSRGGNLYKVDLPDEAIARMLDWDKPIKDNAGAMAFIGARERERMAPILEQRKSALAALPKNSKARTSIEHQINILEQEIAAPDISGIGSLTGKDYYQYLWRRGMDPKQQAEIFRQAGIPGIRYLDGGSRGAGQGTSNYVVFPGNENLLRILERNGVPIGN